MDARAGCKSGGLEAPDRGGGGSYCSMVLMVGGGGVLEEQGVSSIVLSNVT